MSGLRDAIRLAVYENLPIDMPGDPSGRARIITDAVLDALGLEQVGWWVRFPSGIEHIQLTPHSRGDDALVGPYTEFPVYKVAE